MVHGAVGAISDVIPFKKAQASLEHLPLRTTSERTSKLGRIIRVSGYATHIFHYPLRTFWMRSASWEGAFEEERSVGCCYMAILDRTSCTFSTPALPGVQSKRASSVTRSRLRTKSIAPAQLAPYSACIEPVPSVTVNI